MPPCVPGGLNASNPAFQVTVGGVTYNTLNNIVFTPNQQPALRSISDNIGPRVGVAWQFANNTVMRNTASFTTRSAIAASTPRIRSKAPSGRERAAFPTP